MNPQGALSLAIYTKLTYRHPTLIFADENRSFPIPGASLALHADAYVLHGCDASRLLSDALAVLARSRLHVLVARLVHTLDTLPAGAAEVSASRVCTFARCNTGHAPRLCSLHTTCC